MTWILRYRVRNYIKSSMWIVPVLCTVAAFIAAPILRKFDAWTRWTLFGFGQEGARAVVAALATSTLTFTVFVFSMLLIAVQIASAQLSPRIIATTVLKDRPAKFALGLFVFTYTYSLAALSRIENYVPQLSVLVSIIFSLVSVGTFLYLIDYVGKGLRPVTLIGKVGSEGLKVIESIYPHLITTSADAPVETDDVQVGEPSRTIYHVGESGVILALDVDGLVGEARRADCLVVLAPQVGDFVARGEPLFLVFQGDGTINERELHNSVAFGPERTIQQDPPFAFRILVDVAVKALSPGINDPTTAVLAIDQIHRLLRQVGLRHLSEGKVRDDAGQLRLIFRMPNWEDYVSLAVSEIRLYGAGSLQITRRLRAMLENLIEGLPQQRTASLRAELDVLHRFVEREFIDPEDRTRADTADYQGVGGSQLDYLKRG